MPKKILTIIPTAVLVAASGLFITNSNIAFASPNCSTPITGKTTTSTECVYYNEPSEENLEEFISLSAVCRPAKTSKAQKDYRVETASTTLNEDILVLEVSCENADKIIKADVYSNF